MKALNILKPYRVACAALSLTALACPCVGEVVTEWWGLGDDCAHRSMTVRARADGSTEVRFDLSAIPRGAKVFRASLRALPPASIDLGPKPGQTLHAASGVGSRRSTRIDVWSAYSGISSSRYGS